VLDCPPVALHTGIVERTHPVVVEVDGYLSAGEGVEESWELTL
jgi:hypothetical protein